MKLKATRGGIHLNSDPSGEQRVILQDLLGLETLYETLVF